MNEPNELIAVLACIIAKRKTNKEDIDLETVCRFIDDAEYWAWRIIKIVTSDTLCHGKSVDEAEANAFNEFEEYLNGDSQ